MPNDNSFLPECDKGEDRTDLLHQEVINCTQEGKKTFIFTLIFEGEAVGKSETYQSKLSSTYRIKLPHKTTKA